MTHFKLQWLNYKHNKIIYLYILIYILYDKYYTVYIIRDA